MILDQCPHCSTRHVQTQQRFSEVFANDTSLTWRVVRCQNSKCGKLVLVVDGSQATYPGGAYALNADVQIPQPIRDDYQEAGKCLDAGCYKASLVMSRRALQRCLKEQGCTSHKLVEAISEAVSGGILRKAFHAIADEIREYGNLGAHPDDEQLDNASKANAKKVLDFTALIIHEFYEIPGAAAALKAARQPNAKS